MPAPLSNDLRKRIIGHYELGERLKYIAEMFIVPESTIFRIVKLYNP